MNVENYFSVWCTKKCSSIQLAFGEEKGRARECDCGHNIDNHMYYCISISWSFFSCLSAPSPSPLVCWRLLSTRKRSTLSFALASRKREFTCTCTYIAHTSFMEYMYRHVQVYIPPPPAFSTKYLIGSTIYGLHVSRRGWAGTGMTSWDWL